MKEISAACVADIPQICQLLAILFEQEHEFTPNTDKQSTALRHIISQPEIGTILLARQDEKILGMASLLYTISTACGGKVALLEDMIVLPDWRNAGLGSLLLGYAIAHAKSRNCLRITLLTDAENHAAQHFYSRHGFTPSTMIPLRLSLDSSGISTNN